MQITDAGFYRGDTVIEHYQRQHFLLFLTAPDESEIIRVGERRTRQIFRPSPETGFTLSNVLLTELWWQNRDHEVDWHEILTRGVFPSSGADYHDSLKSALDNGFVRYVLDIIPNTWPSLLPLD